MKGASEVRPAHASAGVLAPSRLVLANLFGGRSVLLLYSEAVFAGIETA